MKYLENEAFLGKMFHTKNVRFKKILFIDLISLILGGITEMRTRSS